MAHVQKRLSHNQGCKLFKSLDVINEAITAANGEQRPPIDIYTGSLLDDPGSGLRFFGGV